MWRQTSGWVTCAKPWRWNTDPGVPHTFSRRFLKQIYPKYISDVVSKIIEETTTIIRCFVWICDLPEIGCPVVKVENLYFLDCEQFLFFSKFVEQNARDTKMTTRMPEGARRERLFSLLGMQPRFSFLHA